MYGQESEHSESPYGINSVGFAVRTQNHSFAFDSVFMIAVSLPSKRLGWIVFLFPQFW